MATLQIVNRKLDVISEKLDATDPRHEELHFEAVTEINSVIEEVVVELVNALLFGIEASFNEGQRTKQVMGVYCTRPSLLGIVP